MTTGKTIALIIQTFAGKVMFLLFNALSRFVIAFLPRNKHLLISLYEYTKMYLPLYEQAYLSFTFEAIINSVCINNAHTCF